METTTDLLQKNAIDLIQLGFEDYFIMNEDERRILTSIRNIYSGILLLIKAEIKKRSPAGSGDILILKYHSLKINDNTILVEGKGKKTISLPDFKERFQLLNIDFDKEIIELHDLRNLRNSIEHHFTSAPKKILDNSVLKAFLLINNINGRYCNLERNFLFGKKNLMKLLEIEETHDKLKKMCESKWKEIKFDKISKRIFPIEQDNSVDRHEIIYGFFSSIRCQSCRSDLIIPEQHNFTKNVDIDMKCIKCDFKFIFCEIIEEILERYYAYEIMKAGAKGGCVALSICPECKLGSFLNFENICIYCGNKIQGADDYNYMQGLFYRNVNDYYDEV